MEEHWGEKQQLDQTVDLLLDWAGGLNSASVKLCVNGVGGQADMQQINMGTQMTPRFSH